MRTKFTLTILLCFTAISGIMAQYWESTGALAGAGSSSYLTGATHVGETIFVVSMEQSLAYSTNQGQTWTKQTTVRPDGTIAAITGVKDRLYASFKINTYDHELYYSIDNGATWTIDTVGLPKSLTQTGKSGMIVEYMGDDYVLAYNYTKAVYKKLGDPDWKSTYIDYVIVDIAATSDKWLAIGQGKILQSTDHGESWTAMGTDGLPENFQGNLICSNGSRIYVSDPPAAGADDIYYSDDGGSSWTLTNSSGKYSYSNPWIQNLYAVDDYVFASISPEFANFQDAPPFIISSTAQPDFSVGDVSGLPTGNTNTNLPFFFHIGDKLYTMFWDLYSSEPGFSGTPTSANSIFEASKSISVYPNPATQNITINKNDIEVSTLAIYSLTGREVLKQNPMQNSSINVSNWNSGTYILKAISKSGKIYQTSFIKK